MTVKYVNHDEIVRIIRETPQKGTELKQKTMQKIGEKFLYLFDQFAPRKTGEYKANSWKILAITENQIKIGIPAGAKHSSGIGMEELWVVLEFGVDETVEIEAKDKPMHFQVNGDDVFTMRVKIPPRPPQPHVRTAFDDVLRDIDDIASQALLEVFPYLKKA